ncbi:cytochrome P450, partial [Trametes gibbosa]
NFRRQRRMMHDALAPAQMHTYHTIMTDSVSVFLKRMLDSPEDYVPNIRRYTGGQIASIVYGYKTDEDHDPYLNTADETLSLIANHILSVGSGVWVVDIFPWIKHLPSWFPGAGFKSKANAWRRKIEHCADVPFASVKERMVDGTTIASYCTTMFTEMEQEMNSRVGDPRHEYDIRWTANSMYLASIDTTLALVVHFVLAMVQYPNAARKAQQGIDAVTGMSRLPTFEDRNALPYIDAVLSECMRWTAPVPFGLPHRLTEDDVYNGMTIPAGTLVKMSRDPMLFPDPDAFVPERYLKTMDEATARKRDPHNFIFGFGRRKCSGTHLVNAYLWLVIARLLATFDFDKAKDTEGRDIEPQPEYHDASFRLPTPFPCVIRPRSERAAQLVHDVLSACT